MSKVEAVTMQLPAGNVNYNKNGLRKRKFQKNQPPGVLEARKMALGEQEVWDSLKAHF